MAHTKVLMLPFSAFHSLVVRSFRTQRMTTWFVRMDWGDSKIRESSEKVSVLSDRRLEAAW